MPTASHTHTLCALRTASGEQVAHVDAQPTEEGVEERASWVVGTGGGTAQGMAATMDVDVAGGDVDVALQSADALSQVRTLAYLPPHTPQVPAHPHW